MQGKIIKGIAGFYYVYGEDEVLYECKAKGIFRKDNQKPLVGDNVEITILDQQEQTGNLIRILPRKNSLIRPAVANVDQAFVIFALENPKPNFMLLDRFLIMMEQAEVPAVICFNKKDLASEEETRTLCEIYRNCGYQVILSSALEKEGLDKIVVNTLKLDCKEPDHTDWMNMIDKNSHLSKEVNIALVGKYVELHDSYLSVNEALKHGGLDHDAHVNIDWVDSESITEENVAERLKNADGILVPGGFGTRGIEGKIAAAKYARENKVPYLGICLGLQIAIIEFARNVLGLKDANTTEIDPNTENPVIYLMPDQHNVTDMGGTMRLGAYPCMLDEGSKAYKAYGKQLISERHRHRYEVNNDYRDLLEKNGMHICGLSPDKHIVEMVELKDHPWFVASQAHPEFKSRPTKPHPLFSGLIGAALDYRESK